MTSGEGAVRNTGTEKTETWKNASSVLAESTAPSHRMPPKFNLMGEDHNFSTWKGITTQTSETGSQVQLREVD